MDTKWHGLALLCPGCSKNFTILQIFATCTGELKVEGLCATCGKELFWQSTFAHLICSALVCDMNEAGLQKPQLQLPPAPSSPLSDEDKKMGKDFGIDLEGGQGDK